MTPGFTEPPWYSDVDGIIYAVNGQPGRTTVAIVHRHGVADMLAAAPDAVLALENSVEWLDRMLGEQLEPAQRLAFLNAREKADTAIIHAITAAPPTSPTHQHPWMVNPELPEPEKSANARLLAAADELAHAAAVVHAAIAGRFDSLPVTLQLADVITRALGDEIIPPVNTP